MHILQLTRNVRRINSNATTQSASSRDGFAMEKMTVEMLLMNLTTARIECVSKITSSVNQVDVFLWLGNVMVITIVLVMKTNQTRVKSPRKTRTEMATGNTVTQLDQFAMVSVFMEGHVSFPRNWILPSVVVPKNSQDPGVKLKR